MNAAGQTVCLNMIVKNEAPVIRRCLASGRPLIDWLRTIVDTGSTDGTQDIIRDFLRDLPGELHERPWQDFAHNRSDALALARGHGDYVFVIDADEVLEIPASFALPTLTADSYDMRIGYNGQSYSRKQLVRNALPWRYEGVMHEYITCDAARTEEFLAGPQTVPHRDGARARDPGTYLRDAQLLEEALRADPENPRQVFYLATMLSQTAANWSSRLRPINGAPGCAPGGPTRSGSRSTRWRSSSSASIIPGPTCWPPTGPHGKRTRAAPVRSTGWRCITRPTASITSRTSS